MLGNLGQMGKSPQTPQGEKVWEERGDTSWGTSLARTKLPLMSWLRMTQAFFTAGSVGDKQSPAHVQDDISQSVQLCPADTTHRQRRIDFFTLLCSPASQVNEGKVYLNVTPPCLQQHD